MPIYMKLKRRRETINNIDSSKFLGDPVMQQGFDYDGILGEDEIFLAQIDCSKAAPYDSSGLLPKRGWLWIFADVEEYPYKPRVIYSDEEPDEVLEDYNELWVDDTKSSYGIVFSDKVSDDCGAVLLDSYSDRNAVLLRYDPDKAGVPIFQGIKGDLLFTVPINDLRECNFTNVRLIIG